MISFLRFITEMNEPRHPWQMTSREYMAAQKTGHINSEAYKSYATSEGLTWVKPESYPEEVGKLQVHGATVRIMRSREHLRYTKYDEDGEIARDARGMALMQTDAEAKANGRPLESANLAAFVGDRPVGIASDEWGSTGVWVTSDMQKGGLGIAMLRKFHELNPRLATKSLGQMTDAGMALTRAYHRMLVAKAIEDGEPVPADVRAEYK